MAFFRSLAAASVIPAVVAVAALSSFPSYHLRKSLQPIPLCLRSPVPTAGWKHNSETKSLNPLFAALHMEIPSSGRQPSERKDEIQELLPEILVNPHPDALVLFDLPCQEATEFMVDMKCDGCVSAVKSKLQVLEGVKRLDVDLTNQVIRVLGSISLRTLTDALEQTGRKTRLIGQGSPEDFSVSAAVAEFKGPVIHGVVRFAQVNMELARMEASLSGLSPGKHRWSINEFGDLTNGAASTGKVFNPLGGISEEPLGDLGTLNVNDEGDAFFSGAKKMIRVMDLIGRSIVVYETEDKSSAGIAAAVIARSAGVGENYKRICTCDGTVIWESNNSNFFSS